VGAAEVDVAEVEGDEEPVVGGAKVEDHALLGQGGGGGDGHLPGVGVVQIGVGFGFDVCVQGVVET
jgi:hypothetical protein